MRDIDGLDAGVYHFGPDTFRLTELRKGDYRGELARAAGRDELIAAAPVTIILSTVFWRSSWKYRTRGYRYCFWDNGTVAANLLATVAASGLPAHLYNAFLDRRVDQLLGNYGMAEEATCLISIGSSGSGGSGAPDPIPDDDWQVPPPIGGNVGNHRPRGD